MIASPIQTHGPICGYADDEKAKNHNNPRIAATDADGDEGDTRAPPAAGMCEIKLVQWA